MCSKVASLGTNYICNQSPVAWANKHFSSCTIKSPLITLAYQKTGYATIERNSIDNSLFTTVWLGNAPQFSCLSTSCSQNFNKNLTASRWNCASTKCTCKPGALMVNSCQSFLMIPVVVWRFFDGYIRSRQCRKW